MRVIYADSFARDLDAIADFIRPDSPDRAVSFVTEIAGVCSSVIVANPLAGHRKEEFGEDMYTSSRAAGSSSIRSNRSSIGSSFTASSRVRTCPGETSRIDRMRPDPREMVVSVVKVTFHDTAEMALLSRIPHF